VPRGNNPEKNAALRARGARVVEDGADYDDAVAVAQRLVETEGRTLAHSTNNPQVLAAGAATARAAGSAGGCDLLRREHGLGGAAADSERRIVGTEERRSGGRARPFRSPLPRAS
jgi:Threonine dehydratase